MSGRHRKPRSSAAGRHRRPPGPQRWIAPGLVAVAVLGGAGVGAHAALTDSGSPSPLPGVESPAPTVAPSTPSVSPTPAATASASTPTPTRHARRVALRLVITGSVSWLEVRRPNGHMLASGMFRHGRHLSYAHGPLQVVIGNAGAVQLTKNGRTARAGKLGEVVRFAVR